MGTFLWSVLEWLAYILLGAATGVAMFSPFLWLARQEREGADKQDGA